MDDRLAFDPAQIKPEPIKLMTDNNDDDDESDDDDRSDTDGEYDDDTYGNDDTTSWSNSQLTTTVCVKVESFLSVR